MQAKLPTIARAVAWTVAVGAVAVVIWRYDTLPESLSVTRWTTAPKSPLIAIRVPMINLATVGLIELVSRALFRVAQFSGAGVVSAVLFSMAAAKAGLEALEILGVQSLFGTFSALVAVLVVGLGILAWGGRQLLLRQRWKELHWTGMESALVYGRILAIVLLNLPLLYY